MALVRSVMASARARGVDLEPVRRGVERHDGRTREAHHRLVQQEGRHGHDDLVARVEHRGEGGVQSLGRATRHDDLVGRIRQPRRGHARADCLLKLWPAVVGRIVGPPRIEAGPHARADGGGRVLAWLAQRERDAARGLGGKRREATDAGGTKVVEGGVERQGHGWPFSTSGRAPLGLPAGQFQFVCVCQFWQCAKNATNICCLWFCLSDYWSETYGNPSNANKATIRNATSKQNAINRARGAERTIPQPHGLRIKPAHLVVAGARSTPTAPAPCACSPRTRLSGRSRRRQRLRAPRARGTRTSPASVVGTPPRGLPSST